MLYNFILRYYTFIDDYDTHEKFRKETFVQDLRDGVFIPVITDSKLSRLRRRIWRIIDFKENSVVAKVTHYYPTFDSLSDSLFSMFKHLHGEVNGLRV